MKKHILTGIITLLTFVALEGCYIYLAWDPNAKLADVPDEPYIPPCEPCPPPPPPPPPRLPGPIIRPHIPPSPSYERSSDLSDLRNGGEGRISQKDRKR
ncbi:MAG: hypothetical protein HXY50_03710 [Ignavibacteriaceae bacterium]|nr:hypothetical protein [Ignavibacteriaceae bacterium]